MQKLNASCTVITYIPTPHDSDVAAGDTNQSVEVSIATLTVKALNDTSSVGSDGLSLKFVWDVL